MDFIQGDCLRERIRIRARCNSTMGYIEHTDTLMGRHRHCHTLGDDVACGN